MVLVHPEHPAVPNYPSQDHVEELDSALARIELELSTNEGWEDQGEREGVQLYKKPDPSNPYGVPTVKGTAKIPNCTSEQFLSVIQLAGFRKRWDPRFESGHMLARYSRLSYCFYTEMKGISWLVYPRDIVGANRNIRSNELNQEIMVVQTSVVEDTLASNQSGKTRATLSMSGWEIIPEGNDLKVTYVVKIALNGSIPMAMVDKIATETPLCVGRARDVRQKFGFPPYVQLLPGETETAVIFQTETFSDPLDSSGELKFHCCFTTSEGSSFEFIYDATTMYSGGIDVSVEKGDKEAVELKDDAKGKVLVNCRKGGEIIVVCIEARSGV